MNSHVFIRAILPTSGKVEYWNGTEWKILGPHRHFKWDQNGSDNPKNPQLRLNGAATCRFDRNMGTKTLLLKVGADGGHITKARVYARPRKRRKNKETEDWQTTLYRKVKLNDDRTVLTYSTSKSTLTLTAVSAQ